MFQNHERNEAVGSTYLFVESSNVCTHFAVRLQRINRIQPVVQMISFYGHNCQFLFRCDQLRLETRQRDLLHFQLLPQRGYVRQVRCDFVFMRFLQSSELKKYIKKRVKVNWCCNWLFRGCRRLIRSVKYEILVKKKLDRMGFEHVLQWTPFC